MPKVSVVIPTHNRPDLIGPAIQSILNQTYQDFEIIVVDDGVKKRAKSEIAKIKDSRIRYIQHSKNKGGAAARNTGIKHAKGEYIAFLDDDDEWLSEKLEIQMRVFEKAGEDVGFCFCAVYNVTDNGVVGSSVLGGVRDFYELSLRKFNGFLTVTLVIKRFVFEEVGMFDERFPSHQEPDLMIRITKRYKGLGVNRRLVRVNMLEGRDHIGGCLKRKFDGRLLILNKYIDDFKRRPEVLARHYFNMALWRRDSTNLVEAKDYFLKALRTDFNLRYMYHYLNTLRKL